MSEYAQSGQNKALQGGGGTAIGVGGGLGGALAIILVWLIGIAGLDVPDSVAQAFSTVLAIGLQYYWTTLTTDS